jgi:hypothetical protein
MFNPYLYEKLAQSHHQELPRRHPQLLQNATRRLAAFLLNLPISVKKVEHSTRSATGQL